jgi:hypothetical protein
MNDASTRFAEDQMGAALPPPGEEGNPRVVELAESAIDLNTWATEEGLRGATARELFDGYCRRLSAMNLACICVDPNIASPMERLRLHMATRIKLGS